MGNDMFPVGDMQVTSLKVHIIYGEPRPYLYQQPWLGPVAKATSNYLRTCCVNASQLALFIIVQVQDIKLLIAQASTSKTSIWNKHISGYTMR